jgi:hypothetical protein
VTIIDLEFDTIAAGRAPLGDIAGSLVSVDELLRDLATLAAYPSNAEYREIQVAGITMRSPLTVSLKLLAIPDEAVKAFQEICRAIIVFRDRPSRQPAIDAALARCLAPGHASITDDETRRINGHIARLDSADVPLKAVSVRE